jgi:outer membrane protein assembly factor BamB
MKPIVRVSALVLVTLAMAGCSTLEKWNPFSSSKVKPAELVNFNADLKTSTRWSLDVGNSEQGYFQPVVYDGVVYAASESGRVVALDKSTGRIKWQAKADNKLRAGVAVTADTVAVVDGANQLVAFDFQGKAKWKTAMDVDVTSVPTGSINSIIVRGIDFSVISIASDSGQQRWKHSRQLPPLTLRINSTVDINNARVYAGFPGGRLVGLDLNTGNVVWEAILASPTGTTEIERIADVTGNPVYNFREVCAAAFQGKVGCLDSTSGKTLWNSELSSPNGASVDDRYVIAANELGDLFAYSRNGGKQVWRIANFQRRLPTTPLSVGRSVVIGDFEGYVHFIDRDTGKTIARTRVGSSAFTGAAQAAGTNEFLIQSRKGELALIAVQ